MVQPHQVQACDYLQVAIQSINGYSVTTHSAILVRRPLYLLPMVHSSIVASSARSLVHWLINLYPLLILFKVHFLHEGTWGSRCAATAVSG